MAQDPLALLCIEPCFPGRLGAVADWLVRRRGYRCQFYCANAADRGRQNRPCVQLPHAFLLTKNYAFRPKTLHLRVSPWRSREAYPIRDKRIQPNPPVRESDRGVVPAQPAPTDPGAARDAEPETAQAPNSYCWKSRMVGYQAESTLRAGDRPCLWVAAPTPKTSAPTRWTRGVCDMLTRSRRCMLATLSTSWLTGAWCLTDPG
jgi:hypothetical protein